MKVFEEFLQAHLILALWDVVRLQCRMMAKTIKEPSPPANVLMAAMKRKTELIKLNYFPALLLMVPPQLQ
jgi:hypothetical protein